MHTSRATARLSLALPLAASLLLAGCGGGGGNSNGTFTGTPPPAPAPLSVSAATPSGLIATLAEDKSATRKGDSVTYTMTLTNSTGQPITFTPTIVGGSSPTTATSLQIADASGKIVFTTMASNLEGVGSPETLNAGQILMDVSSVPAGIFTAPGRYTATAGFRIYVGPPVTADATLSASQTTTVGPLAVTVQ